MIGEIREHLKSIEKVHNVNIILAVESGSRSWGIPSETSDFDVRFLYVPKKEWYLSIEEKRDVIDLPVKSQLDMHGWELRKALRLLHKHNPQLLEWLHSDMVYFHDKQCMDLLREVATSAFSAKAALFHYHKMAKRNFLDFFQENEVVIKKYFYVLRPLLACLWIEKHHCFPPVQFVELVKGTLLSDSIKEATFAIIEQKQAGVEKAALFHELHDFIETELERIAQYVKSLPDERKNLLPQLNAVFREILQNVWERRA